MLDKIKRIIAEGDAVPFKNAPLKVGDEVSHPDLEGSHKIHSMPTGKNITGKVAYVYPAEIVKPEPKDLIKIENPERLKVL
jgi:hypothetical protein